MNDSASAPLDRFRNHVMADEALQIRLARCESPEAFVALALDEAARAGIALSADSFGELRPDPIGMFLGAPAPIHGASWPGPDWRPIQLVSLPEGGIAVDWVHFAGAALDKPFFATNARNAAERPFNLAFRYRVGLDDFIEGAAAAPPPPDGFIFHMSRCGSTLVSQMLAALPDIVAVSEPPPLDIMVRLAADADEAGDERGLRAFKAMVHALGRDRPGGGRRFVFKLDSWQTIMLPFFRRAFPAVPWVFIYRDPVEVLVSLILTPSIQVMANVPHHHRIETEAGASPEEYIAQVLERVCTMAADCAESGGLLVSHEELPGAIGKILAHLKIHAGEGGSAAMAEAARRDAKSPWRDYQADSKAKRSGASPAVRAAAERHLAEPYRRLEALRRARNR